MLSSSIAIFGYYRSAVEVASYLKSSAYRIVIIDDNKANLEKAHRAGFETAALDYRDDTELQKLGLGSEIDTVFSLFPDDAENVFLTISARALAPDIRIVTIAHGRDAAPNLRAAGADKVIETREISGCRIWDIMTRPIVTAILDHTLFGQANLNIAEVAVPDGSFIEGRSLSDSRLDENYDLMLIGLVNKQLEECFVHGSRGRETWVHAGDILVVIGPTGAIDRLKRDLASGD